MLDFVSADEEDARTIHWVYSIEGDVGKSWLKDYMVKTYEALVVAVLRMLGFPCTRFLVSLS